MKSKKILIVDDHAMFRSGLKSMMVDNKLFKVVSETSSGKETLEKLEKINPDIVLLDISLKDMNGIDLAKTIRELHPDIKIIMLTMHNNENFLREAVKNNVDGYVLKTEDINELFEAIKKVVEGDKFYSQDVKDLAVSNYSKMLTNETDDSMDEIYLTKREKEIIQQIAKGLTYQEIAEKLFISQYTVINHRQNIAHKLGLKNNTAIVRYAMERGIIH